MLEDRSGQKVGPPQHTTHNSSSSNRTISTPPLTHVCCPLPCWPCCPLSTPCRTLFYTDFVACFTSVLAAAVIYGRTITEHPTSADGQPGWAAFIDMVNLHLLIAVNAVAVILTLALMAQQPALYYRYRLHVCLLNRLLRVLIQTWGCNSQVIGFMLTGITARSLSLGTTSKGLALLMLHPTIFFLQQGLFILPPGLVLLLQLVNTSAALYWSMALPCVLQHAAAEEGGAGLVHLLYAAAEKVCVQAQSWAAVLRAAGAASSDGILPGPSSSVCEGVTAVQTLHMFCNLSLLLLLPVGAMLALEGWLRACQGNQPDTSSGSGSSIGRSTTSSGSGSSSSRGTRHQRVHQNVLLAATGANADRSPGHAQLGLVQLATEAAAGQTWHVFYVLLLAPAVLGVTWLLAELLAGVFAAHVDCPAVLHAAGIVKL